MGTKRESELAGRLESMVATLELVTINKRLTKENDRLVAENKSLQKKVNMALGVAKGCGTQLSQGSKREGELIEALEAHHAGHVCKRCPWEVQRAAREAAKSKP